MDNPFNAQPKIARYTCPACAGPVDHALRFNVNGCDIWQCRACGLGRAETIGFDPGTYYTGEYFSGRRSDGYADYLGAEPVLRCEFAHSVEFIQRFCDSGRLLELGCAFGFFLKEAQRCFEVSGIELAEEAAEYARRSGLHVLSGVADDKNLRQIGPSDVIVLFDDRASA
jgi:hypothetical protein